MIKEVIYYTAASLLSYQILRAAIYWLPWFAKYMFDEGFHKFKSKIEKPRLFFHINTIGLSLLAFTQLKGDNINFDLSITYQLLYLTTIIFFGIIFQLTWHHVFEARYVPAIKRNLNNVQSDFRSDFNGEEARNLFGGLLKKGFLVNDDFERQTAMEKRFVEIFVDGILPEYPEFDLQMKNDQIAVFYDQIAERTEKLDLLKFTKIFTRKGNEIKLRSLTSSKSRSKNVSLSQKTKYYAEHQNIIENLFQ